jgi:crotonobetainyl-CoA:carnitine CoA-transferase CaiB-like acyl-CoA transferase
MDWRRRLLGDIVKIHLPSQFHELSDAAAVFSTLLEQYGSNMTPLPLAGLRVLDLTRVLAGPLCTMMLGDLGALVIKVEKPGSGDDTRGWGPPFDERGESAYYLSVNRNKYSVAADLSRLQDRALIEQLAAGADVLVDNFLPGTLERFGLDVAGKIRSNAAIWCTITGFGIDSRRPGYDFVVQAEAGWMAITGDPNGDPMKTGVALADLIAGKDAAIAILAALVARERKAPHERRVVISLSESARAALTNVAQNALVSGTDARRWGNAHANLVPYQLFNASDRAIVIAVGSDAQWVSCVRALGLTTLEQDDELSTNRGRLSRRDHIVREMQRVLAQRTAAEWLEILDRAHVPAGIVKTVLEAIHESANASPFTGMASSVGGRVRFVPPRLDEHGKIIRQLGWDAFDQVNGADGP